MMVKLDVPVPVGVPLRTPPLERLKPLGNEPEVTAYVYGPIPPDAVIVWLYAVLCVPAVSGEAGDSVIVGAVMVPE